MRKLTFLLAFALCVCACKEVQFVTVPQTRVEYVHDTVTDYRTDSVLQTRYVYTKADTVHDVQIIERIKWRDKVQVQRVETHDSIPYPVEIIKHVRARNGYDYFTAYGFWILFAIVALAIVIRIYLRR